MLTQKVLTTCLLAGLSLFGWLKPAAAALFESERISNQGSLIAVAAPIGDGSEHQLLVIEQKSNARPCWSTSGQDPAMVDPLLLGFNFTGICDRKTDANGYSARMANEDVPLSYRLSVIKQGNNMLLVARNPVNRADPAVIIGQTNGVTNGFAEIQLNPGWYFSRRTYQGQPLGLIYFTNNQSIAQLATPVPGGIGGSRPPVAVLPPSTTPAVFPDIVGDTYRQDIEQAVQLGFVSGFPEDNTFRPQASLTREQLVSMVLEALTKIPNVNLTIPTQATGDPYPDVAASRWSAAKIQFARDNRLISGYQDGSFRPGDFVKRSELIAIMRRAAEYGQSLRQLSSTLVATESPTSFSDTQGNWAAAIITQMSTYCGVASPLNESGSAFFPNVDAKRDYATAATLRTLKCIEQAN
ncbi:MAG: DUF3747 domain-containing protein [Cyanobacteria bacterium P01_H01_bin.121]